MPAPPRSLETLAGMFIPPASREVVVGDLHERCLLRPGTPWACRGLPQYVADVVMTVPLVILSRIRRTTDFQVLLMEAFVLYLSFWGAARFMDAAFLDNRLGFLRLAIPAATTLLALMLEDAYAMPGRRWPLKAIRAPVFGLGTAVLSQWMLPVSNPELTLPRWILWCGAGTGLLLVAAVRMLFPPPADRPQGAPSDASQNGPAFWMQQASEPVSLAPGALRLMKGAGMLAAAVLVGALAVYQPMFRPQVLVLAAVLAAVVVAVYQVRRWR
ncbi:MAG TPA: hypothetical protein VNY05_25985 [Candidatus Acidoferrales bacterium]|jgi:hypothetical protein|nr:hypothetical protein [Candidatus Acidoferrales bacterium]